MKRCLLAALSAVLLVPAAAAQDRTTTAELEALIPDSAIEDPEAWAEQGVPTEAQADLEPWSFELDDPDEIPLVDLPSPDELDVPEPMQLEPEDDIRFAEDLVEVPLLVSGEAERLSDELAIAFPADRAALPERRELLELFEQLSSIREYDAGHSSARLAAQARVDEALLLRLLRLYGYYDAQVVRTMGGAPDEDNAPGSGPAVQFDVIPGHRYTVGSIDLGQLAEVGPDYPALRQSLGIVGGDPLNSFRIEAGQASLDLALGEGGYPFASIGNPDLLIDHERREGDLGMNVRPGGKYRFGAVASNLPRFLSGEHLAEISRFRPGDIYQRSLVTDLRRALQETGIVAGATITPVETKAPKDGEPGTVDLAVEMAPASLRTIAGSIGYGSGEGIKAEASWEHRNLFPPEGALKLRGIVGTREQLAGITFRRNNFKARNRVLTLDAFLSTLDYKAYDARAASFVAKLERVSTLLSQEPFSWSLGLELTMTGERAANAAGVFGPRRDYAIAALPGYAQWDTSDDLLNPGKGFRLALRLSPEIASASSIQSFYLRGQIDTSFYLPAGDKAVIAARARFASIPGAPLAAIAPSRRLYAGGGGSVRGYSYHAIGPRNDAGDPSGGRSLTEFSLEARIDTPLLDGALAVVPFVDAGAVGSGPSPDFKQVKFGAGIGVRYLTSFGPIRVDLGIPLNRGPADARFGVYVGLGQAF